MVCACCCTGPVVVPCCSNGLPTTLFATLSNVFGCACASGTITLTWDAINSWWQGTGPMGTCGFNITLTLRCSAQFTLGISADHDCGGGTGGLSASNCCLFSLTFQDSDLGGCSCNDFQVVITP